MPPVPTYVYVAPEMASEFARVPVVTETDGDTAAPKVIEGLDAVTVIGRVATVIVCAELVATKYEESAALVAVTAHVEPATPVSDKVVPEIEQPAVPAVLTA